jgi:polyhydroxybutyrate depolymerase
MPLVVNLHGRSSTAYQQEAISKMNKKADEEGFIVVNPQAEGDTATWWGPIPGTQGQPDRDFFEMLLLHLQSELSVDPIRIYATGLSNGASMANRLGCDMSETFAAIAPVAGGHVAFDQCTVASPVAVVVFHSTGDHIIPYEGNGSDIPAVRTWVEAWAQRNGCRAPDQSERPYPDVMLESWDDCSENAEVWFFTIEEGGHSWPGLEFGTFEEGYPVKVGATDVIWDFFKTHPKE